MGNEIQWRILLYSVPYPPDFLISQLFPKISSLGKEVDFRDSLAWMYSFMEEGSTMRRSFAEDIIISGESYMCFFSSEKIIFLFDSNFQGEISVFPVPEIYFSFPF
jgi:hypothetical protein